MTSTYKKALLTAALIAASSAGAQKTQLEFWTISLAPLFNDEMNRLAELTGGRVFDGRKSLEAAFKEIRGYQ